ncbi:putative TPR-repeat protein [Trypanosoma theileri]|uniref:RNA polymerase II-associated protein 3 n=1 Tax=Trypanosoma theileri TaxID=67003 RepID=A0A1X0NH58_9TRYP|nr:putative TPR-repeat protein [Trypanosoma theileri]ORC83410.1 putative TPR-repeat protein [Trypanosoma theileri]
MDYASAIRQQAEDLKDELRELDIWQEEVQRQQETKKKRKVNLSNQNMIPPVRGTVPSLKEAVLKSNGKAEDDPVKKAKEQGNDFFQAGKLKEAIEAYSNGIDLDPDGSSAHVLYGNRALCNLKLEKWDDAERDASSCVRLNHSYAKGYFRRAMARKKLGNLKGARTDLEAVLALSPNDASATAEMKLVTQMLQLEREKSSSVVKKKKIVIAEVDDDDDDDDDDDVDNDNKTRERAKVETVSNKYSEEDENIKKRREEQIRKEMEELKHEREMQRNLREVEAKEAESKLSGTLRTSARVEVIEDEVKPVQSMNPIPETKSKETVSVEPSSVYSNTTTSESVEKRKKEDIVPRTLKTSSKWSKETLKVPKSFTEFERVFSEIKNNQELCSCYVSLIPPSSLRTLFGNNMTPEILLGLLSTLKQLPGTVAVAFLKGLCGVKRVEDISLFFDNSEKKVVGEVLDLIVSCGASEEDVKLFKRQLRVL